MKSSASPAVDPLDTRGAGVRFLDGSTFTLIRENGSEYVATGHPRGMFPNEATEFSRRLYGSDGATAGDWHLLKRLEDLLARTPAGMRLMIM